MLLGRIGAFVGLLILGVQARADDLALARKGKKQQQETHQAADFAFQGNTLTFDQLSDTGQKVTVSRQVSAIEWAIEIRPIPNPTSEAGPITPILTSQPNQQGPRPVKPEFYDSVPQAIKDVDLQRSQQEGAEDKAAGSRTVDFQAAQKLASNAFPTMRVGDLTSCKGLGQDWIIRTGDEQRTRLLGKVVSIDSGWLIFQRPNGTARQKYRLYDEIAAIGIGTCPESANSPPTH